MTKNKLKLPRFVLAGANSGVGKTTITLGLLNHFCKKGVDVQPFKTGPDYIDPAFHTFVTGAESRNLDSWLFSEEKLKYLFIKSAKNRELSIIEGAMGLYDGNINEPKVGSTAHVSKIIEAPVVLIINGKGISTSAAALVYGYANFDKKINIAGVIINNVGSKYHYEILQEAIESSTGIKCYGYLTKNEDINLESRHLGLIPAKEVTTLKAKIDKISDLMKETIDFDGLLNLANTAPDLEEIQLSDIKPIAKGLNIGVAMDKAFNFYYKDNLELLEELGAKLHYFSPLKDSKIPDVDGLYIGGGFPEVFASELSKNESMKQSIKEFAEQNKPVYAECGGLMYCCNNISNLNDESFEMVSILQNSSIMTQKLQRFGYINIEIKENSIFGKNTENTKAHEFHRSKLIEISGEKNSYNITKKQLKNKVKTWECGYSYKNFLGGYAHIHFYSNLNLPINFLNNCKKIKNK